jgi:hypothetical protein
LEVSDFWACEFRQRWASTLNVHPRFPSNAVELHVWACDFVPSSPSSDLHLEMDDRAFVVLFDGLAILFATICNP